MKNFSPRDELAEQILWMCESMSHSAKSIRSQIAFC